MLGHYIPENFEPFMAEPIQPIPNDYFIWWLFKHRCICCKQSATEINEIIPRSRSKKSIHDWRNRVTMCRTCHTLYHLDGVTQSKMDDLKSKRKEFLISMGRQDYV